MKALLRITIIAAVAFLWVSCKLDFLDENNTLCKDPWLEESVSVFDTNGTLIGFTDKTTVTSYLRFGYTGAMVFQSEAVGSPEYGFWKTEVIPKNGTSFEVILIPDEPSSLIPAGHSGEPYTFTLTQSGDTLDILHRHYDEPEYTIMRFLRSNL